MVVARKIKAVIQLLRVDLSFAAGICVVVGEIVVIGSLPSLIEAILEFTAGFFISTSALILNDYFDLEIDEINAPGDHYLLELLSPLKLFYFQ